MHEGNIVIRIDLEYNMNVIKTSIKCSETHIIVCLLDELKSHLFLVHFSD